MRKVRGVWRLVKQFMRPYVALVVVAIFFMLSTAALDAYALKRLQPVLESIFQTLEKADDAGATAAMEELWHRSLLLMLAFAAAATGQGFSTYLAAWVGQGVVRDIRQRLFERLETASLRFLQRRPTGELVSRISNDTMLLQRTLSGQLADLVIAPAGVAFYLGLMFYTSWRLSLLMLVMVPSVLGFTKLMAAAVRRHARRAQEKMADVAARIEETFFALRVVRVFGLEGIMAKRFWRANDGAMRENLRTSRLQAASRFASGGLGAAGVVAVLILGGREIIAGRLGAAALMTFIFYALRAGTQLGKLTQIILAVQQAEAAALRTIELLQAEQEPPDPPDAIEPAELHGALEFRDVWFSYEENRPALRGVSFSVEPGEHVAIVGPSGGGKTTIANLAARLYDPERGQVLVDGVDLRKIRRDWYRRQIALVPQETILFAATVRENIAYGRPDATEEEIVEAARAAYADEFIRALPQGYDTVLADMGQNLSGGQRQRIAIARAFLRRPKILIMDEATSALDRHSEAAVQRAVRELLRGRTAIIIAHRLSTIQDADRILVVADGRIVEEGTHAELMSRGGLYSKLYRAQATAAEDAGAVQAAREGGQA